MRPTALVCIACAILFASASPSHATRLTVDPSGSGDFTTVQAALDSVDRATQQTIWPFRPIPDSIVVLAGHYPEHLRFPDYGPSMLVCPSGPDSTTVLGVAPPPWTHPSISSGLTLVGLGFVERVAQLGPYVRVSWRSCKFWGGYEEDARYGHPNLTDCDFFAPVILSKYAASSPNDDFIALRFHDGRLTTSSAGSVTYRNCTFTGGPTDTLVMGGYYGDPNILAFRNCTFETGAVGIHFWSHGSAYVDSCMFRNLATAVAVHPTYPEPAPGLDGPWYSVDFSDCRVEGCGRALHSDAPRTTRLTMRADKLIGCTSTAVEVMHVQDVTIDNVLWSGGAGAACLVETEPALNFGPPRVSVLHSTFDGNRGLALGVSEAAATYAYGQAILEVRDNRVTSGDGGMSLSAGQIDCTNNVLFANSGPALALTLTGAGPDSVRFNTCALNAGDGIRLSAGAGGSPGALVVERNLLAMNGGGGIHAGAGVPGAFAGNDAWQNYGAAYSGFVADPTNLALDPRFCDLAAGDLSVSIGSPCAPSMPAGPIGALGVGCGQELLGVPPVVGVTAFSVRPSPARGNVEFAVPPGPAEGRVEVLDAQGRRVWSAQLAPGAGAVRWRGELANGGSAAAGLYWVRLTRAEQTQTRHFVWLR